MKCLTFKRNFPFENFCDGSVELSPMIVDEQEETDETNCIHNGRVIMNILDVTSLGIILTVPVKRSVIENQGVIRMVMNVSHLIISISSVFQSVVLEMVQLIIVLVRLMKENFVEMSVRISLQYVIDA